MGYISMRVRQEEIATLSRSFALKGKREREA